jgi:hypothetical protein
VVINGYMQGVISQPAAGLGHIRLHAVAWALKACQFLGIQMQQLTSCFSFITTHGRALLQGREFVHLRFGANSANTGYRNSHTQGDVGIAELLMAAQINDAFGSFWSNTPGAAARARGTVK